MDKTQIRVRIKAQKALLSDDERLQAAREAFARLEGHASFKMASRILMYHSLPDELPTLEFIDKWHASKQFYLPRVNGLNLEILPYDRQRLSLGAFHIEEPQGDDLADVSEMELIVVPAVAYDRQGNRVGRGKGYYDRLLADSRAMKVGIAYDFQVVDAIDAEPHDVRVDVVITDRGVYKVK